MASFEALGSIIKEESLYSITEHSIPNSLVLETKEPFPGYHHDLPKDSVPRSVFLVLNHHTSREQVTRARKNILRYADFDFDAAFADVFFFNETYSCIRIKNLNRYEYIEDLQSHFINEGFSFRKAEKIDTKAIIKVKKTFILDEIKPSIFTDQLENYQGYVAIPKSLSWKLFEKITRSVKNNWEGKHFDAAYGFFYRNFDIHEVVRIFHHTDNNQILSDLQALYLKEIAKY